LNGGAGNDIMNGHGGTDTMTGGSDTFDFNSISEAGIGTGARDVVTDVQVTQAGEIIDLSTIDASAAGGNNAMRTPQEAAHTASTGNGESRSRPRISC
jgi:Ca2+-binding RTX toxin-like protein